MLRKKSRESPFPPQIAHGQRFKAGKIRHTVQLVQGFLVYSIYRLVHGVAQLMLGIEVNCRGRGRSRGLRSAASRPVGFKAVGKPEWRFG